jgi:hypothetical protein
VRRWGIGLAAFAVAAVSLAATRPPHIEPALTMAATKDPGPLYGIVGHARRDTQLVRLDPRSLRPLPGPRFDVVDFVNSWTFSPDRSRVALGTACQVGVSLGSLQLVDLRRMRPLACFAIGGYGDGLRAIAWPTPNRVLAVSQSQVVLIDAKARRVIKRTPLQGVWLSSARAGDRLIGLTGPARDRSERLVVADPRGNVRSVAVDAPRATDFVVDSSGRRAYLVSAAMIADVDLETLAVAYHELREPVSLFRRALAWLVPAAQAKEFHREHRRTLWLGGGLIASFGSDVTYDSRGRGISGVPVGLRLIDTRDWTVRMVDEQVSSALLAGDVLLAVGTNEIGLVAYDLNGTKRYQLFRGRHVVPRESHGGKAWIDVGRPSGVSKIVDVRSGRVVGSGLLPTLLVER